MAKYTVKGLKDYYFLLAAETLQELFMLPQETGYNYTLHLQRAC